MSMLADYRRLERKLARKLRQLEALKRHPGLQREIEFEEKLFCLLADYNFSTHEVFSIFAPCLVPELKPWAPARPRQQGKRRDIKHYSNPYTGEILSVKSGSLNKTLKSWRLRYGPLEVESWMSTQSG
ncbi:histone-like nucleoid-structuring protein, MvaT/MvaU family [Pseudomonas sp. FYR_11]|uniref:histone-like nucleoid-structuring protein, MvaT/MvaU family n=1 Tax=Pseudomonas TaxID=286 RepID=UPI003709D8FA